METTSKSVRSHLSADLQVDCSRSSRQLLEWRVAASVVSQTGPSRGMVFILAANKAGRHSYLKADFAANEDYANLLDAISETPDDQEKAELEGKLKDLWPRKLLSFTAFPAVEPFFDILGKHNELQDARSPRFTRPLESFSIIPDRLDMKEALAYHEAYGLGKPVAFEMPAITFTTQSTGKGRKDAELRCAVRGHQSGRQAGYDFVVDLHDAGDYSYRIGDKAGWEFLEAVVSGRFHSIRLMAGGRKHRIIPELGWTPTVKLDDGQRQEIETGIALRKLAEA